jgi:nucleotide-binding universal stress UspA family protein
MSTDPEEGMAGMRRILVGIDGSEASHEALGWATMVARASGAQVVAMNGLVFPYSEITPETSQRLQAEQAEQLEDWAAPVLADVPHELEVRPGDPRDAIPDAARDHDAELVVVASSGATGRSPGFLHIGSVAEYLAHHVERPLAIVPPEPSGQLARIVVAVDGSQHSRAAVRWAADLAAAGGAEVTAVAVAEPRAPIADVADDADEDTWRRAAEEVVRADWAEPLRELDRAADVVVTRQGPVPEAILETAAAQQADVLVVGARGLGGFTGLRAGGVALAVVHRAELPVIVVPSSDDG